MRLDYEREGRISRKTVKEEDRKKKTGRDGRIKNEGRKEWREKKESWTLPSSCLLKYSVHILVEEEEGRKW